MFLGIAALEISFIVLLAFMLGLSGFIGAVIIIRIVEPQGLRVLSQRLIGLPKPRRKTSRTP
jgi:hypothetical protein